MARIVKNQARHHRITLEERAYAELVLVRGGRNAYLWLRGLHDEGIGIITGQVALRKLAHAILREVPPAKRRR